ncbi:MAG: hypothetical protein WCG35_10815 [Betaproteobacteria bacterium]
MKTLSRVQVELAFDKAIADRNVNAVEELLPQMLKIKPKGLFQAIENADIQCVRLLVKSGISLESRFRGGTPLLHAIFELSEIEPLQYQKGDIENLLEIINYLLDQGADINACAPDGTSVGHLASCLRNKDIENKLIRMKAVS